MYLVEFRLMVYEIPSAAGPACIHEIRIDVIRVLQGVDLGDHPSDSFSLGTWHFSWFDQLGGSFIRVRAPHVKNLAPTS